jgi:cytochrome c oxidase assembly protein subunit 15
MLDIDYKRTKPVAVWLYICAAAVFVMALIGAITRLTESGLSMVEWRPLIGALPPLNEAEWIRVFDLYKQTPEYEKVHNWMMLADFQKIFFWEWFHRLWGRMIGLIYAVPFLFFIFSGRIPREYRFSFWAFLILGASQGLMGWYMVQSGLVDRVDVSHYRLAAHLGLAFFIFCLLFDMALKLSVPKSEQAVNLSSLRPYIKIAFLCAFVTMIWGAFVAGLNAGLVYNEFPMMGKYPWPTEGLDMSPIWINVFENHAMVQFSHRFLAILTFCLVLAVFLKSRKFNLQGRTRTLFTALIVMSITQVILGITTLLTQVKIIPAVAHQGGAMILIALLIAVYHETLPYSYSVDKKG